jgi:hypothetical protein
VGSMKREMPSTVKSTGGRPGCSSSEKRRSKTAGARSMSPAPRAQSAERDAPSRIGTGKEIGLDNIIRSFKCGFEDAIRERRVAVYVG